MKDCSKRHGIHSEDANYCWQCGERLEEVPTTCECGNVCGVHDHYCPRCGKHLERDMAHA